MVRDGLRAPCERVNRRDVRQRTQFLEGTPSRLEVECAAGLGLHAEPTRLAVRRFGLGGLATQTMNLAFEVVRSGRGCSIHRRGETAFCALRFFERRRPRALQLHELSAMHEAAAREG